MRPVGIHVHHLAVPGPAGNLDHEARPARVHVRREHEDPGRLHDREGLDDRRVAPLRHEDVRVVEVERVGAVHHCGRVDGVQVDRRFARDRTGRRIDVVRVEVEPRSRREHQRRARRELVVARVGLRAAQEDVEGHRGGGHRVQRAVGAPQVAHGVRRGDHHPRRARRERVQHEVVAAEPHGRLDPVHEQVRRVRQRPVGEQLALEGRVHREGVDHQLDALRRGRERRVGGSRAARDTVEKERRVDHVASGGRAGRDPALDVLDLSERNAESAERHLAAQRASVMYGVERQLDPQEARVGLARRDDLHARRDRVAVRGQPVDQRHDRAVVREHHAGRDRARAAGHVATREGARLGEHLRLDASDAGDAGRRERGALGVAAGAGGQSEDDEQRADAQDG